MAPVRANRELFAVARYSVLQHCPLSLFDSLSLKSLTTLGNTAVACAAVDDVTAWRLLAVVIATVEASGFGSAILTILLTLSHKVYLYNIPKVSEGGKQSIPVPDSQMKEFDGVDDAKIFAA
jgi:hypothetical protein